MEAVVVGLLLIVMVGFGCAPSPLVDDPYQFDDDMEAAGQFEQWFDGEMVEVEQPESAEQIFLVAESSFWEGDYERAYELFVQQLREHPGHALNRYAVDRLARIDSDIADFSKRLTADLSDVTYDEEDALTRLGLARLAYRTSRTLWHHSDSAEPFHFEHAGFVDAWTATPALSPWPTIDFDEPMAPETSPRFDDEYVSPLFAEESSATTEPTQIASVDGLSRSLNLGPRGVYYLEAELQVGPDPLTGVNESREMTISGQFAGPARVWIGDEKVLEHRDDGYESAPLMRQVELQPGSHRVLVKLGYEPGSRDWFELLWLPQQGVVFGDAKIDSEPTVEDPSGGVRVQSSTYAAREVEPVRLGDDELNDASSAMLYLGAVSAYLSDDAEAFGLLHEELMDRHPEFGPGFVLASHQVDTRADLPSETRQSRAISYLRRAEEVQPDNLKMLVELERRIRGSGSDEEHRRLVEQSRDRALEMAERNGETLPQLRPLISWAQHLQSEGWSNEAEDAWQKVIDSDPGRCTALRQLRGLYRNRNYLPDPEELSDRADVCTGVMRQWLGEHPQRAEQRVEFKERQAARYPYNASSQANLADALVAAGRRDEAEEVLDDALELMPWERRLWEDRIELALGDGDDETARALLDEAGEEVGRTARLEWLRARLDDELPLESLLRDGREAAAEEVRRTGEREDVDEDEEADRAMVLDDAYYVVDVAGRKYFEDGSAWNLTHQVVRVMTRGAIDDYAEMTVPGGAELLKARTIKEDGEVRVPDGVTGDSTLSMPGLSPGDMVEIAYLEFDRAPRMRHRVDGRRFYFQMPNVSSRLSEYVVLGGGLEFESANGAPEAEPIEAHGVQGVRFTQEDTRRPRSESRRVPSQDWLPWVREVRRGVQMDSLDFERRYMRNALESSSRMAPALSEKFEEWLGEPVESMEADDEAVRRLFYEASDWFRDTVPGRFSVDAVHALEQRRGSPLVVIRLALDELGVDNDVYIARTDEQPENIQQVGEIDRYVRAVMRVEMPDTGEVKWLKPDRRTAMFGAVEPEIVGQNAVCISCEEFREETIQIDDELRPRRHIELDAKLDMEGMLTGTMSYEMKGVRAARVRSALRSRTDEDDRRDYFERVLTDQLSGADLVDYRVEGEDEADTPLRFEVDFERSGFARVTDGAVVVDRPLFRERMQRVYAREASRNTPMFVGYEREQSYQVRIELPEGATMEFDGEQLEAEEDFGSFERVERGGDGAFEMESSIRLPRQRISPEDYGEFRDWARAVEESGSVWFRVQSAER